MVKVDSDYYRRRAEVPAETFAVAHPSGWRRHLPFTRSWVTTGLHRDLRPPLTISTWCMVRERGQGETLCVAVISLPLSQGFSTLHDIDASRCRVAEISDNLAGYKRVICLNVKILR